jgi:hypothetical protein
MNSGTDMRIPVLFGGNTEAGDTDAWLVEDNTAPPLSGYAHRFTLPAPGFGHASHAIGCNCCAPRGPAADALARMFRARATGTAPFFKRVLVLASPAGEAAIREALTKDVMTAARYVTA